jgi:hypothetical protein
VSVGSSRTGTPTFVLCVESGIYESMAVRAVESLRMFGGRFADSDVLVLTSRVGPPLARSTRADLANLDVRAVFRPHFRRDWFPWMGKVWAARDGEQIASTDVIAYVDCDILFLGEPAELLLSPETVIAAAFPDSGIVGTTGPGSLYESAWRRACDAVGISLGDLPWVDPGNGSERIRFYLNAGIFTFRNGAGVPEKWLRCTDDLFRRRADFGTWREQFYEQVALGLSVVRFGLPFEAMPYSHNFGVDSSMPAAWESPELATARILHYHDQLGLHTWRATVDRLEAAHPEPAAWLARKGPLRDPSGSVANVTRAALRRGRLVTRRGYRFRGWLERKLGRERLLGGIDDP